MPKVAFLLDDINIDDVVIPISVGAEYHEGEDLEALINLLIKKDVRKVTFLIAGMLQRFNIMIEKGINEEEAKALGIQKGKEYVERNQPQFNRLGEARVSIIYWEDIVNDEDKTFKAAKDYVDSLEVPLHKNGHEKKSHFTQLVNQSVSTTIKRFQRNEVIVTRDQIDRAVSLSKLYIKEECAVVYMLENAHFIYPKENNVAILHICELKRKLNQMQPLPVKITDNEKTIAKFFSQQKKSEKKAPSLNQSVSLHLNVALPLVTLPMLAMFQQLPQESKRAVADTFRTLIDLLEKGEFDTVREYYSSGNLQAIPIPSKKEEDATLSPKSFSL